MVSSRGKYRYSFAHFPPYNRRQTHWTSPEVELRTQGSRPRTQKNSGAKAKDSLSEDRHSRGQGHKRKCSPKKKKRVFIKIFQAISKKVFNFFRQSPQKNVFQIIFQVLHKILTIQKIVLSSSRGQANFRGFEPWGLEAEDLTFTAKAKDFKMCPRGLHLWTSLVSCQTLSTKSPMSVSVYQVPILSLKSLHVAPKKCGAEYHKI